MRQRSVASSAGSRARASRRACARLSPGTSTTAGGGSRSGRSAIAAPGSAPAAEPKRRCERLFIHRYPVAGLDPATHVFFGCGKDVDARDKPGQGGFFVARPVQGRRNNTAGVSSGCPVLSREMTQGYLEEE